MVYRTKLVIPMKIRMPSFRIFYFDKENIKIEFRLNLDLLDEKRERADVRQATSKHQVAKYYNRRVKHKSFFPSDLVLKKVTLSMK